jgi:GTP cyclohydrolase II/3,4-dihydroxy-2-butanone 4-phosphate synthase
MALEYVQQHGGAIIYLQQEGRGIGLANKVAAYSLQDAGLDTVDANLHLGFEEDARQYGVVPSILADMGIGSIQLMTNNPRKVDRLRALGVNVVGTVPMVVESVNKYNRKYMEAKHDRMAHTNFGALLQKKNGATSVPKKSSSNGAMMPKRGAAVPQNFSLDTISATNEVHVSLLADGETISQESVLAPETEKVEEEEAGVRASADGYCFGRQSVEDAIAAIANGEMVVVVDDMDRENEGDLIMAADLCTPKDMAQIVRYSSGVICVGMEGQRMDELKLPAMVVNNEDPKGTAFSVTVDATKENGAFPSFFWWYSLKSDGMMQFPLRLSIPIFILIPKCLSFVFLQQFRHYYWN